MSTIVTKPKPTKNEKNKNYTVKIAVEKLSKNIENIYSLFCLIDMNRYFKNIDVSTLPSTR